jgi:hypothetical protein
MNFEQEIHQLQDTLIVMAEIQRRQAEVRKMQAERTVALDTQIAAMTQGMSLHEERMNHVELNLAEMTDKLNGLIGFMDGFIRKQ